MCLDANEIWGEQMEVTKFADKMDRRCINREFNLPASYPHIANCNRSTTIDFCLCSSKVLQHITYAAAIPFELETLGDHRGMVMDLDLQMILGKEQTADDIKTRKLVMSSPKTVEKYIQTVDEKFEQQNIFNRSKKLLQRVENGHTDYANIMKKYEALDKEVFRICSKAGKNARLNGPRSMNGHPP